MLVTASLAVPAGAHVHHNQCWRSTCVERVARKQCDNYHTVACIRRASLHYKVSFYLELAIARCESTLLYNPPGNPTHFGLFQFDYQTYGSTPYGKRGLPILTAKWNALAGAWGLRHLGTQPWVASEGCWG